MPDFNERLLKEIGYLRYLQSIGIESDRIHHCLEILRLVRNTELGLDFEQAKKEEEEWMKNNDTSKK